MSFLTTQEKNITIFLLSTALIGSVIGIFRHNWINDPKILLSPENLTSYRIKLKEDNIIKTHNIRIVDRSQVPNIVVVNTNIDTKVDNNISTIGISKEITHSAMNKSESNKKKISQNPSGIININIASKEEIMTLPYIGEVKAERIIKFRTEIGSFVSIKDLEKVKGIGPKILAKIEPFITIK